MTGEDGKADLLQRSGERLREARLVRGIAVQEPSEIERRDLIFVVESVVGMLGETIGVRFPHLIVADELPVDGIDVGHSSELPLARCQGQ